MTTHDIARLKNIRLAQKARRWNAAVRRADNPKELEKALATVNAAVAARIVSPYDIVDRSLVKEWDNAAMLEAQMSEPPF